MLGGAGGAKRCHGVRKSELGEGHHVHVALDHQRIAALAQRLAGLVQAVEFATLDEHRGLRRVEVLRLAGVEHATAEADHFALHRADREHDAVAEAVVALLLRPFVALHDYQTRFGEQRVVVAREHAGEASPAFGRVAHAEACRDLAGQSAALEIVHRARAAPELLAPVLAGLRQHLAQRGLALLRCPGALALLGRAVFLRHGHAQALREVAHRLGEVEPDMLGQKAQRMALGTAAEAVIELLGRDHVEARRLLAVEGAQALEVLAGALELDVRTDDLDDVGAGEQFVDESLGDHARSLGPGRASGRFAPGRAHFHFGASRIAPSRRMTSPLSISLVRICCTNLA
ncbi:hypothetical protein X551_04052 [Methylibium sp. T29]|nr:hypothetical protein X551_04052 [Methylibium sp. T29]